MSEFDPKPNRYTGEIRINPVPALREDDFNNDGLIEDIGLELSRALEINESVHNQIARLQKYLAAHPLPGKPRFAYAPGGYIELKGVPDEVLLELSDKKLIDLFDWASDRDWVKRFGRYFGLIWENGKAVRIKYE